MGKCDKCGKKIEYNKFKRYRKKILCYECYDTRLERKKAKKEAAELAAKDEKELNSITEDFAIAAGDLAKPPETEKKDSDADGEQTE